MAEAGGIGGDGEVVEGDDRDSEAQALLEDQSLGAGQFGYDAAGEGGGVSGGCVVVSQDVAELEQVPQYIRGLKEAEGIGDQF